MFPIFRPTTRPHKKEALMLLLLDFMNSLYLWPLVWVAVSNLKTVAVIYMHKTDNCFVAPLRRSNFHQARLWRFKHIHLLSCGVFSAVLRCSRCPVVFNSWPSCAVLIHCGVSKHITVHIMYTISFFSVLRCFRDCPVVFRSVLRCLGRPHLSASDRTGILTWKSTKVNDVDCPWSASAWIILLSFYFHQY